MRSKRNGDTIVMQESNSNGDNRAGAVAWRTLAILCGIVPLTGLYIIALLNGQAKVAEAGKVAYVMVWIAICAAVIAVICTYKIRGRWKLLSIVSFLASLVVCGLVYFDYLLSGYGNLH